VSGAPPLPLVTVAVLTYNRRDMLAVTLGKVFEALDYPADRLEVIVVDNASTDGTTEMVRERFPQAAVIRREENAGIASLNRALERARGDWVLVLDDDCYMEGEGLRRAVRAAAEHDADLVSFSVDSSDHGQAFSDFYRTGLLLFWACSVLLSRRAIERLGGFDGRMFIWGNEVEFTMRLLDAGLKHLHMPEVRSVHMKPLPRLTEPFSTRNLHNLAYVAAKLLQPADAAVAVWNLAVQALIFAVRYRGFLGGVVAVMRGFRAGLAVRQPVRRPVSRLYRRNFIEFASQLRPWPRLRHVLVDRGRPGTDYRRAYWSARPRLYPPHAAGLRIP
jgi:GT2 family glycosyltransferase